MTPKLSPGALEPNTSCQTTLTTFSSHRQTTCSPPRASTLVPQQAASPKGHQSPQKQGVQHQKPIPLPSPRGTPPHCSPQLVPGDGEGRRGGHQARSSPGTDSPARSHIRAARRGTSLGRSRQNGFGGFLLCSPTPLLSPLSLSLRVAENNTIAEVWEQNQLVNGRGLSLRFRPAARGAQLLRRSNKSGAIWLITRLSEAGSRCKKAGDALLAASAPATPSQTQTQDLSYAPRS